MRVIMAGGGTGGHIYPAIAIADRIKEKSPDSEILFVGTRRGLESTLVPNHGYDIRYITVSGVDRKNPLNNIKTLMDYRQGCRQVKRIIERFNPDVVIGTGGYVSGPVLKVANTMGVRTFIQEQNAFPGLTNKLAEKFVENVFLGFEAGKKYFKHPEKHVVTGNPVRKAFFDADPQKSREELGLSENQFALLVFGGSQGAGRINASMMEVIRRYNGNPSVQIYFATGKAYYEPIMTDLKEMKLELMKNIHILEYIDNMELYLSACDLVVGRSGALSISEILVCGKPSILIPSPNVTGDHQTFNARAISDKGGAILLPESELSGERLYDEISKLKEDRAFLKGMAKRCAEMAPDDACDIIYYTLLA